MPFWLFYVIFKPGGFIRSFLVKICCISSLKEARIAIAAGADLLGFVSDMPSGPGVISLQTIQSIVSHLPPDISTVLLTSKVRAVEIFKQYEVVKTRAIQLVDSLPRDEIVQLRKVLPDILLIQVVHVQGRKSITEALAVHPSIDMLILDSGQPFSDKKTLGGTGQIHDWKVSREICDRSDIPVLLAGGLNYKNVDAAIMSVSPDGVDVCSGVHSKASLNEDLLRQFMDELPAAQTKNREH